MMSPRPKPTSVLILRAKLERDGFWEIEEEDDREDREECKNASWSIARKRSYESEGEADG